MKMLTVFALLCAMMALTRAAALPDAENEPGTAVATVKGESHVVKRAVSCPCGWTTFNDRCFLYIPRAMTWAQAEKNCESMGGHLASVRSIQEYQEIQKITPNLAWIGGSNAQELPFWFWSDGTRFLFTTWCPGEPNNYGGNELSTNELDRSEMLE